MNNQAAASMETTAAPGAGEMRLWALVDRLEAVEGFRDVVASLQEGHSATLDGVWGSSCALAAAALLRQAPAALVVVSPHSHNIDEFADELALFSPVPCAKFPAWDVPPKERVIHDEVFADRLSLLKRLNAAARLEAADAEVIVTSIQALLQTVPERERLVAETRTVRRGDRVVMDEFLEGLVKLGFLNMNAVELPGEFAARGGIVDIFAPDWTQPVRLEFFGDEIESIRRFEVASQRSLATLDEIELTMFDPAASHRGHFADYLPENTWYLLVEPTQLEEEGGHYLNRLDEPQTQHSVRETFKRMMRSPTITAEAVAAGSYEATCHLKVESVERFAGDIAHVRDELQAIGADDEVIIVTQTEAEVERLEEVFRQTELSRTGRLHFPIGQLHEGFRFVPARVVVLSSVELFGRVERERPTRRHLGRVIDSFLDLSEGDFVVHVSHGVARYHGLKLLEKNDQAEEHLELEFAGGTKLYVPTSKIDLVQKYAGGAKARPKLARIGSRTWLKQKQSVEQAVTDLASEMLDLNAMRASRVGISYPADTHWQHEFDASFPYTETPDQLTSLEEVKTDMLAPRPMDRLICGDVGYGKTEIGMRAAFKAVNSGYQVAVLVPTTVLAEQHRRTFTQRMAEFPFEIASLSRFLTRKQQQTVLERVAAGQIDIVIGTHRLVQSDVHFDNIGLVIIDEEQRFGVQAKQYLKALRATVDVLTLTATPIPRTLHMGLLGLRDISNLETPPEDRLAVETRVTRFDEELIRHTIMRELNRDGQIFFVHNRVHDIHAVAARLQRIVPEARMAIGHGQMPERQLEKVMSDFVNHEFDMLVSTTIVESGLDIPNANTIFIDQADNYGLADLHQLRGRVGRYKHRAYCYMLIDPNKSLTPVAAKRLRAIEEFSDMGAGFAIAMRDLEIRGAGNILGTEQSGHIAAVGYELYCRLLENAVRRLKHLPPKRMADVDVDLPEAAYLPGTYIPDMRTKIDMYRRLSRASTSEELDDIAGELADRFGPRTDVVDRLIATMRLRIWARGWGIVSIRLEDNYAVLDYTSRQIIDRLVKKSTGRLRVADGKSAYLPLKKGLTALSQIVGQIESLLQPL